MGHRGGVGRSRQGWGVQKGPGGKPGMNLSDPQGPRLPPAATAALRRSMSRLGETLQGPAKERDRSRLGSPTSAHPASVPLPPGSFSPLFFPSPGSTSSLGPGCHFFPRTCGCSRRESGVPQDWNIRVEHLETRRDARGLNT